MNIRFSLSQLETFVRIVDAGSFHAAGKQLFVSTSSVSQRIAELENAVNLKLFVRQGTRSALTVEGESLLEHARQVVSLAQAVSDLYSGEAPISGHFRLGAPHAFVQHATTEFLDRTRQLYPQLKVSVLVADRGTLTKQLLAHELDMAILINPSLPGQYQSIDLGESQLVCFSGMQQKPPSIMSAQQLADCHLMIGPQQTQMNATVMEWFAQSGVSPNHISYCNDPHVVINAAERGWVVGILPYGVVREAIKMKRIRHLKLQHSFPISRVAVCYRSDIFGAHAHVIAREIEKLSTEQKIFVSS